MASVHLDETTPHMHLGFVPVVREKKNQKKLGQEKVSAKELLTRSYMKNLHKRLKNVLERDLNCQVDITIDRDEDAPKREYVPLTRLKKQTEAEAKKLESLKKQSEELQGEIDSLKELKKSQDQQCRELTDRECRRIRDQNAKLESRRVELIQEINQLAPKTVSYWKSFHDYTKQWFEKIQRPKVFEKIFNDFHLSYFKSITEPKMKQRSEPER